MQNIRAAFASGAKAPLYVLPCGGGKTTIFSAIAESSARRSKRVLILCHRVELVDQIVAALKQFDVIPDVIAAGYGRRAGGHGGSTTRAYHAVSVASVQTLVRRLDSYPDPTMIIVDEAHHTVAGSWSAILNRYKNAKVLGLTASPIRLDGRGLTAHFDRLIVGPSVAELTAQGFLAPARIFAPPTVDTSGLHTRAGDYKTEESSALLDAPGITGNALSHYLKHAPNLPALVFCTSVSHAHHVAEQFRDANISAVSLHGGTDCEVRRLAVNDFREGRIKVVTQCGLANEGWDLPGVHCGIFLRPTTSLGLWIQMTGRCSRPSPGKSHAILLDHVGNCQRLGMPDEPRDWQLTADVIKRKEKSAVGVRICHKCFAASSARASACIECGTPFMVKPREIAEREGELVELTAEQIAKKRERQEQGRSRTLAELEQFARMKGYAPGWPEHVLRAREARKQKVE